MKAKQVMNILKISRPTLCSYLKNGLIKGKLLPNKQYDYDEESIFNFLSKNKKLKEVIYCRVSSTNQKQDLENQIKTLTKFCEHNGIIIDKIYSDIKSGLHFERPQFEKLLESVMNYEIKTVYITYKDRFSRLSYELMEKLFNQFGCNIISISDLDNKKTTEQEFLEDIITLIHCFSMKMYSKRRKEKLELIEKDLKLEQNI